jgi:hypothetical protein
MSVIPPTSGFCLTGPSMVATGVAAGIVDATRAMWPAGMLMPAGFAIAALVNVIVFFAIAWLWYRKASRRAYVAGLLIWLGAYLFWSMIYAPPTGCLSI